MNAVIGIDGHVLTGKFQGTRTTLGNLLKAVAPRLGDRTMIVYADDPDAARDLLGVEGLEYRGLGHAGSIKRLALVLPRLFRRDGVTLGVFQYMMPFTGRHVVFIHDILPLTHPQFFPWQVRLRTAIFFSLAIRRAAMVIAVSAFTRDEIARVYKLRDDRLRLIPNGPSFAREIYAAQPSGTSDRIILTVGRIERRKNVKLLVEAFQLAQLDDVRLFVVGSHDLDYDYALPDDPMIENKRNLDDEALVALYRQASLFVYPSAAEGFGMPLLDALLFGLPVIAADTTALPEVGGALATYFDCEADDAAQRLAVLLRDHFNGSPVARPTQEERAELATKFNWDQAAAQFLDELDAAERAK